MTEDINDYMECKPSTSKEDLSMEKDLTTCSLCQDVYVDPSRIQCCGKLYCRLCLVSHLIAQQSCPACSASCPATGFAKWILPDSPMHQFVLNSMPLESAVAYNNKLKFCNELRVKGKLRNIELELAARSMVKWADHVMLESDGKNIELRIRVDAKILKPDQGHEETLYIEDKAMVFVVEYNMQARLLKEFLKERLVKDESVVINLYTKDGMQIDDSALMHQILLDSGRSDDGRVWIFCDFIWEPLSELIEDMPVLEKECYETEAPTLKSMLEEPVLDRNNVTPEVMKMNNDQLKVLQRADSRDLIDRMQRNSFGNSLPRPEDFQPLLSVAEPTLPQLTANHTPPKSNGVTVANHPVLAAQLQQPMFSLSPQGKKRPAQSPMNGGKPAKIMNSTANMHSPLIKSALEGPTMSTGSPSLQIKAEPGKPVTPASASNGFGMVVNQARAMAPGMTVSQAMAMSKNMANNKGNSMKNGQNPFLLGALKAVPALGMQNKSHTMNPSTGLAGSSHSPVNIGSLPNGMPMLSLPSPSPFHSASSTPSSTSPTVRKPTTSTPSPMSAPPNANMALFQQMLSQQMPNFAAFNPIMLGQLQLPQLYQQNLQAFMQNAQFPGSIFPPQFQKPKKSATVQPIVRSEANVDNDKLWQMYNSTDECKKTINQTNVAVSINQPGSL